MENENSNTQKRFVYQRFRKPRGGERFDDFFTGLFEHLENEFERLADELQNQIQSK